MNKKRWLGLVGAALIVGCAYFSWIKLIKKSPPNTNKVLVTNVAQLPKRAPKVLTKRLSANLIAPTNKWFSSLALGVNDQPVYSYPLSLKPSNDGFSYGVPLVVGSNDAVFGSHLSDVTVSFNSTSRKVSGYDDLSVSQEYADGTGVINTSRLTQGSPFIFTNFARETTVNVTSDAQFTRMSDDTFLMTIGERTYGLFAPSKITVKEKTLTFSASKNQFASFFTLPAGSEQALYFEAAQHPITHTSVSYSKKGNSFQTLYELQTDKQATIFASMPNMNLAGPKLKGTFASILGTQSTYKGNVFSDTKLSDMPSSELNISKLTQNQHDELVNSLKNDASELNLKIIDSYFGAKEVYRAANLLQLAHQLNQVDIAHSIQSKLSSRLDVWFDTNGGNTRANTYFYYDTEYHGVVAEQASFGSENFNDHHFHYGYFIYASAILGKYDQQFLKNHGSMVNTLIADIASSTATNDFPKLRVFDSYAGHSWASGNGDFADGSNQESTSEAINAWYAVYLWGGVSKDQQLQDQGQWLYTLETNAAQNYWLDVKTKQTVGPSYEHSYAGIIWSGKIDYSTFFSVRPQAILGIQLIPMSPAMLYLARNQASIKRNLDSTVPTPESYYGQFHDYLLMYQALTDPKAAELNVENLSPQDIDGGNSRTYLLAWVYAAN